MPTKSSVVTKLHYFGAYGNLFDKHVLCFIGIAFIQLSYYPLLCGEDSATKVKKSVNCKSHQEELVSRLVFWY